MLEFSLQHENYEHLIFKAHQNYKKFLKILPKNLLKKSNFSLIQSSHSDHNFDSDVSLI